MLAIVTLPLAFLALYYGSEWLVNGSVRISDKLNLPRSITGLLLVAFGTSAPELVVNALAAYSGSTNLAFSNIVGSNLANLCLGFGLCSLIGNIVINRNNFRIDILFFACAPLVLVILFFFSADSLSNWSAGVLLFIFALYLGSMNIRKSQEDTTDLKDQSTEPEKTLLIGITLFVFGCALLYLGGDFTIRSVESISRSLNVTDTLLGLILVALGTSIPDITASVVATKNKEIDIAVGNLIGSNIFNILFVIGCTILVSESGIKITGETTMSYYFVLALTLAFSCWIFLTQSVRKNVGFMLLLCYVSYITFRVIVDVA